MYIDQRLLDHFSGREDSKSMMVTVRGWERQFYIWKHVEWNWYVPHRSCSECNYVIWMCNIEPNPSIHPSVRLSSVCLPVCLLMTFCLQELICILKILAYVQVESV